MPPGRRGIDVSSLVKPIAWRIVICVAFGAVLTLASAWLPGAFTRVRLAQGRNSLRWPATEGTPGLRAYCLASVWEGVGVTWLYRRGVLLHPLESIDAAFGLDKLRSGWASEGGSSAVHDWVQGAASDGEGAYYFEARGWPMRTLWCEHVYSMGNSRFATTTGAFALRGEHGATPVPNGAWVRTLPYRPIGSGLAINLAFWSAAAAPLVFAPTLVRRLRRRPGACPACRYDLRGLPAGSPCPECGRLLVTPESHSEPAVRQPPYGPE